MMSKSTTYKQGSKFWIALIDMMTSILIIFLLVTFLDSILNPQNIELAIIDKKRKEFIEVLKAQFRNEIQRKTIQLEEDLDHLQITFSDKLLFETAQYSLLSPGQEILKQCSKAIKEFMNTGEISDIKTIQVEGHTDSSQMERDSFPHNNWELSTARALEVIYFLENEGIARKLFSANGFEANRPISKTDNDKNRRIELKIFFSSEGELKEKINIK